MKLISLSPTSIGVYRCVLGALFLLSLSYLPRLDQEKISSRVLPNKKALALQWLGAVFFSADLYFWHRSVVYSGAGLATVLANTQVFYVALLGVFFFGERPRFLFWLSLPLALLGVFLLSDFQEVTTRSDQYWLGILFGLLTGIVYAGFLLCLRSLEKIQGPAQPSHLFWVSLFSGLILLLISFFERSFVLPKGVDWIWLLLLGLVVQGMGWTFISKALPRLGMRKGGLMLLLQPSLATALGAWIFQERLNTYQLAGLGMTLLAIYLGMIARERAQ